MLDRRRRESRSERAGRRSVACFEKAAASLPGLCGFLGAGDRAQPAASAPEIHRRRRVIRGKRAGPPRRRSVAGVEKAAKARRSFAPAFGRQLPGTAEYTGKCRKIKPSRVHANLMSSDSFRTLLSPSAQRCARIVRNDVNAQKQKLEGISTMESLTATISPSCNVQTLN